MAYDEQLASAVTELSTLHAEVERLKDLIATRECLFSKFVKQEKEIAELTRQRDEAIKDAERYRYGNSHGFQFCKEQGYSLNWLSEEAIDAAIKESKPKLVDNNPHGRYPGEY